MDSVCVFVCVCYTSLFIWLQCFRRGREDLKAAIQRINQILADYGDVVPRRDYEQSQAGSKVS